MIRSLWLVAEVSVCGGHITREGCYPLNASLRRTALNSSHVNCTSRHIWKKSKFLPAHISWDGLVETSKSLVFVSTFTKSRTCSGRCDSADDWHSTILPWECSSNCVTKTGSELHQHQFSRAWAIKWSTQFTGSRTAPLHVLRFNIQVY